MYPFLTPFIPRLKSWVFPAGFYNRENIADGFGDKQDEPTEDNDFCDCLNNGREIAQDFGNGIVDFGDDISVFATVVIIFCHVGSCFCLV